VSIDYHLYVGPFFQCMVRQVEKVEDSRSCGNPGCHAFRQPCVARAVFCAVCGVELQDRRVGSLRDSVDWCQVAQRIDEALHCVVGGRFAIPSGLHVWLPNERRQPPRDFKINPRSGGLWLVGDFSHLRRSEMDWLRSVFGTEEGELVRAYGPGTVRTAWGAFNWSC
jgi:hypothetical protein